MADKENQGLLHIQVVELSVQDELSRHREEDADYPDAVQLLSAIPRNSLMQFRLINAELVSCDQNLDTLIEEVGHSFYEQVTRLRIVAVDQSAAPVAALHLLQTQHGIDTLTVESCYYPRLVRLEDDEDYYPFRRLLKGLFAPADQFRRAGPLSLKELNLHGVDIGNSPHDMFRAMNLPALETLRVTNCPGTDIMFTQMSKLPADTGLRLRTLRIYFEKESSELWFVSDTVHIDRTINSINDLLLSMKDTLQTLWIIMRGVRGRATLLGTLAPGIANHGASLLRLTVDVRTETPPLRGKQYVGWFPHDEWEQVCARFKRLEQLYVPFPPVVADENLSCREEFTEYLRAALQISTLKTLNMNTWPYPLQTKPFAPNDHAPYSDIPYIEAPWRAALSVPESFYHHCLSFLVKEIVKRRSELISNPRRDLDFIGFGLYEDHHYIKGLHEDLSDVYFVRSKVTILGKEEVMMTQHTWDELHDAGMLWLLGEIKDIDKIARRVVKEDELGG
ncbi:MAG: hypothetical protein Q9179_003133 [Wetmoreana sp. 5 TL-2023]